MARPAFGSEERLRQSPGALQHVADSILRLLLRAPRYLIQIGRRPLPLQRATQYARGFQSTC